MKWETPRYVEMKTDAEISPYKNDFDPAHAPLFDGALPQPEAPTALESAAE